MARVRPSELREFLLRDLRENKYIVFIWGQPGVGKSSIVAQCAAELGLSVYPLSVALEHPHALGGFPAINWRERSVSKFPPSYAKSLENCVLFLDDFAASDPSQQRIALSLTTYRRIGDTPLPDSTRVVLASNRVEDLSYIVRPSLAVMNRMKHYTLIPSLEDWIEFMLEKFASAPPILHYTIAYLSIYPQHFCYSPSELSAGDMSYPTPRTWDMLVSDINSAVETGFLAFPPQSADDKRKFELLCQSCIGEQIGQNFANFACVDPQNPVFKDYSRLKELSPSEQARVALAIIARSQDKPSTAREILPYISDEAAAILVFLLKDANVDVGTKLSVALKSFATQKPKRRGKDG